MIRICALRMMFCSYYAVRARWLTHATVILACHRSQQCWFHFRKTTNSFERDKINQNFVSIVCICSVNLLCYLFGEIYLYFSWIVHTQKNLPIPDLTLTNRGSEMIGKKSKNRPINRDRRSDLAALICYFIFFLFFPEHDFFPSILTKEAPNISVIFSPFHIFSSNVSHCTIFLYISHKRPHPVIQTTTMFLQDHLTHQSDKKQAPGNHNNVSRGHQFCNYAENPSLEIPFLLTFSLRDF